LRDAVVRCNAEGLAGLHDRPRPGSKPRLDEARRAAPRQLVLDGAEVEATGVSAWTLVGLCREVEARRGVRHHEGHMSKLVRALGLSRQKARPSHRKANPAAREASAKGGSKASWTASRPSIPAGA
jgi:transposase